MSVLAIILYAGWTQALVLAIGLLRTYYTLSGQRRANQFAPSGDDVSAFSGRLCRAHANCFENLPVFASVVLAAVVSDHAAVTDPLALPVVGARIAQSVTHIISTRARAVLLRFVFFVFQIVVIAYWVVSLTLSLAT